MSMRKRRTVAGRYERAAMRMLKRYGITWEEEGSRRLAIAHIPQRRIVTPRPRTALGFYIFAHEVAHIVHGHSGWPTTARGQAEELEADRWALARLRRIRGYVPATVGRSVRARVGKALRYLMVSGMLSLGAAEKMLRQP